MTVQSYPENAKYLLRFDDLSPAMNWNIWSEIEDALVRRRIKPLLAVIPDNQDPKLRVEAPVENFWERVRKWQSYGWTIGLHGFQHKYITKHAGIVTSRTKSEFAGLPAQVQEEKLRRGMEIFAREGIKPTVWIAPNHSFDFTTIALLSKFGTRIISDGQFRFPLVCSQQMFWVPQQIFRLRPAPPGMWTVCYHHNQWTPSMLAQFHHDLDRYGADIWPLETVTKTWSGRRSPRSEWLCRQPRLSSFIMRCRLKAWLVCRSERRSVGPRQEPAIQISGHAISEP